jgi:hypothetical protein
VEINLNLTDEVDWETLVTGILAVGAAWLTIWLTLRSERRQLWREANAARATLPLVLSEVVNWTLPYIGALLELMAQTDAFGGIELDARQAFRRPETPKHLIPELKDVLRSTDDPRVIGRITLMVGKMQVLAARIDGMTDRSMVVTPDNIAGHITDLLIIHAQAESLFNYARRRSETTAATLSWSDVLKPLDIGRWFTDEAQEVAKYVKALEAAAIDPEHNQSP